MKPQKVIALVMIGLMTSILMSTGFNQTANVAELCGCQCQCQDDCAIMKFDEENMQRWVELHNSAPRAHIDPETETHSSHFSLLPHLNYVPAQRSQGSCGNCWAWAGTGVVEIALDVQEGIYDRLSVQYFNSKYNGGTGPDWACCGGWLVDFAAWYDSEGFIIPWSNTNAHWQDGGRRCCQIYNPDGSCNTWGSTSVPAASISTTPQYQFTKCDHEAITTHDVGTNTAITNIKNVLHQNRAVWFAYYLWNFTEGFRIFWWNQPETDVWDPDPSCGQTMTDDGGGHAVLVVGYNDDDPDNRYWIVVNSWGTAGGLRPNGIFCMDMDMNYDCTFKDGGNNYWSFYWETLDLAFEAERDIEAVSQTHTHAQVVQGFVEPIEVTVRNNGGTYIGPETFDVKLYADLDTSLIGDEIPVGTITVIGLASGTSTTITFNWDTTGVTGGTYTITAHADSGLTIPETDEDNNWCTDPSTLKVMWEPIADINGPYTTDECTPITFDASGSSDPDGTIVLYEWDMNGDAVYDDGVGISVTWHWGDDYSGTVGLRVTDNDGLTDTDTTTVTVLNVPPTASIDSMTQPNPEFILPIVHTLTFTGSFADPGWLDTHTATWDFGDGTVVPGTLTEENVEPDATGTTTADHVYSEPGFYTVTLTITDDDGGVATATMQVTVVGAAEAKELINEYIQGLPNSAFKGNPRQRKKAFDNMFSAIDDMLEDEEYNGAIQHLQNNIREKTDGYVDGSPKNDWIIDEGAQLEICMKIDDLIAYLATFL